MKSLLSFAVIVVLLAVTAPLNEAARRRIDERQHELSVKAVAEAEALREAAAELDAQTNGGDLIPEARQRVRAEALRNVLLWLAFFGALAVFMLGVAAFFVYMLIGNEWRAYLAARRRLNQLQAEYEALREQILKARQKPQRPLPPPVTPTQPPPAPIAGGGILDTRVSSNRRRRS